MQCPGVKTSDLGVVKQVIAKHLDQQCPDCKKSDMELTLGTALRTERDFVELIWTCSCAACTDNKVSHMPKMILIWDDKRRTAKAKAAIVRELTITMRQQRDEPKISIDGRVAVVPNRGES